MDNDEQYVPTDEDVYGVWTNYQCFHADDGYGPRGLERAAAEMDRYIARVRREAKAEALREAAGDIVWSAETLPHMTPHDAARGLIRRADRIDTADRA